MRDLGTDPLIFDGTRLWVMPKGYESGLALRLDSKIFLYEENDAPTVTPTDVIEIKSNFSYTFPI